jgi:hypothetical protein
MVGDGAFLGPSEDSITSTASFKIRWTPIRIAVPLVLPCVSPLVGNASGLLDDSTGDWWPWWEYWSENWLDSVAVADVIEARMSSAKPGEPAGVGCSSLGHRNEKINGQWTLNFSEKTNDWGTIWFLWGEKGRSLLSGLNPNSKVEKQPKVYPFFKIHPKDQVAPRSWSVSSTFLKFAALSRGEDIVHI